MRCCRAKVVEVVDEGAHQAGSDKAIAEQRQDALTPLPGEVMQATREPSRTATRPTETSAIMNKLALNYLAISLLGVSGSYHERVGAQDVIAKLGLEPNPEKGYYRQTFEDAGSITNRSYSTAIYYLLEGQAGPSYWHRVTDAVEIWHFYAGAPLRLELSWNNGTATQQQVLGSDIFRDQSPQVIIDKGQWQRATSLGNWTLVGTTVAPGFSENGYELPEPGFHPDDGQQAS